ncbi:MAG: GNAT family N-acetyltransferase [Deltaproteobacteria bacterium]|nr:GNAT family N-acetyltransferase [Deltaproteobacteria bacterium]
MILPHEVAKLEDARLALAISELADESLPIGGGFACYGGSAESWMNLVVGVGMESPVTDEDLDRVITFYKAHHAEPRVEVCPFADPSLPRGLGERGFRLAEFETVLYRELEDAPRPTLPTGVTLEPLDPAEDTQLGAFVDAHVACFAPDGGARAAGMAEGARRMALHPRTTAWLVRVDGELAGGAAIETLDVSGTLGTLIAAGILPPYRRRGIQRALIDYRCAAARRAGCTLATISSDPQSATGRNALRAGFVTAYTKAILARQGG